MMPTAMAPGLRPLLTVFRVVILWWSLQQCRALDNSGLLWRLESRNELLGPIQLTECDTVTISLSYETNNPLREDTFYYDFTFELGGMATIPSVGDNPSSLHWTIQHPAGTQLFVVLFDSFGTFLELPLFAVIPGSKECWSRSESPDILEVTEPKITLSTLSRLISCGLGEMSFPGGKPPYLVSIVALESMSSYNYIAPPGNRIFPHTRSGVEVAGKLIVIVRNANGILGTMCSIINATDAKDMPSFSTPEGFSRCRPTQPSDIPLRLREPPRPSTSKLRRSSSDHRDMQPSRELDTISSKHEDTIAVAACVSLGVTGIVVMAICVIIMYRRRQKVLDAQDTLPRPFEIAVPAATTSASTITHDLSSIPILNVYPPRVYSQSGGRGSYKARGEMTPTRIGPSRASSAPIPTTTIPSPSQPGSSRDVHMQPHLSDTSLPSNQVSNHTPPRSWTHPHALMSRDPRPQPGSRVTPRQSSETLPTAARPTAGAAVHRSASTREQRSAKYALWLSHSASELYRTMSSVPRYRAPEYGLHASSDSYAYRHDGQAHPVDALLRPTNHLRQWHSASPVVHVQHACSSSEELGGAVIFQHQDAGAMQELPPPYHKLVRSGTEV